jgi:hypothetical protein
MLKHIVTHSVRAGLGIFAAMALGCGELVSAPSSVPPVLSVTAIAPNTGSTAGTSAVKITGTGFQPGATVTVDGTLMNATVVSSTNIAVNMPAHATGTVDVVVANRPGEGVRVPGGYTYVLILPAITQLAPTAVTTGGGAWVSITGTGFQAGATVSIDGRIQSRIFNPNNGIRMDVRTEAHTAGAVDLVVTNPDGQTMRVPQGLTYTSPGSLNFNGDWLGSVGEIESPHEIRLTIQNNVLISLSVSCGASQLTFALPAMVTNGEFSVAGSGGSLTGRILTDKAVTGTHNLGPCPGPDWFAWKP